MKKVIALATVLANPVIASPNKTYVDLVAKVFGIKFNVDPSVLNKLPFNITSKDVVYADDFKLGVREVGDALKTEFKLRKGVGGNLLEAYPKDSNVPLSLMLSGKNKVTIIVR